ncbi:MAG: glycogen debranching enzyme N-terminal domain-containing protein, partial [Planctomycetota bacterium]
MKPQDGRAEPSPSPEWLETDGLGGFASGTRDGHRTRRYHALLCAADSPPVGRRVLVPGLEVWVETADGAEALSTQVYEPDVVQPRGFRSITAFDRTPWPTWRFAFSNGTAITFEVATVREQPGVVLRWRHTDGPTPRALHVRPFVTDRDFHHLDRANDSWNGSTETRPGGHTRVTWRPYPSDIGRAVDAYTDGSFRPSPQWYFNFRYRTEIARGLDSVEDLGSPGVFTWETWSETGASLVFAARRDGDVPPFGETLTADLSSVAFGNAASELLEAERRRRVAAVAATPANDPPTRLLAEAAESY